MTQKKNAMLTFSYHVLAAPVCIGSFQRVVSGGIIRFSLGAEITGVEWWHCRQGFQLKSKKMRVAGKASNECKTQLPKERVFETHYGATVRE